MKVKSFLIKQIDENEKFQFAGYGSTFDEKDREGDIIEKGTFDKSLKHKSTLPLLFNHDRNQVIGKLEASEDEKGLFVKGYLNLNDEKAKNVYDLIKMGALDSLSIGFSVKDYLPIEENRPFGPWRIKEAELYEISVVTVPANSAALISNIKSFDEINLKNLIKKCVREVFSEEEKKKEILKNLKSLKEKFI